MAKMFWVQAQALVTAKDEPDAIKFFIKSFPLPDNMVSVTELSPEQTASYYENLFQGNNPEDTFLVDLNKKD